MIGRRLFLAGGTGGIGRTAACAAARRGWWPVVAYRSDAAQARAIVADAGCGEAVSLDVRDVAQVRSVAPVDALVYCAGIASRHATLLAATEDELDELLNVHALGLVRLVRALTATGSPPHVIVAVLSTAARCDAGGPYALSKAAGLAACVLLAGELPRVAVHAVLPGWTETGMARRAASAAGRALEDIRKDHLDGRLLEPDGVGELCADLLAERTSNQLVWWDRRSQRLPHFAALDSAFVSFGPSVTQVSI